MIIKFTFFGKCLPRVDPWQPWPSAADPGGHDPHQDEPVPLYGGQPASGVPLAAVHLALLAAGAEVQRGQPDLI